MPMIFLLLLALGSVSAGWFGGKKADVCEWDDCSQIYEHPIGPVTEAEHFEERKADELASIKRPPNGTYVIDEAKMLSKYLLSELNDNLTDFHEDNKFKLHIVTIKALPDVFKSARDYVKALLKGWYGKGREGDKTLLMVFFKATNNCEIASGVRARKKLKDAQARRITRRVNQQLAKGKTEEAIRLAQKLVGEAFTRDKGMIPSIRALLSPVLIIILALFMFNKFSKKKDPYGGSGGMGGMGGMGGISDIGGMGGLPGMGGMGGIPGMPGMAGMGGMGGAGMGGMGGMAGGDDGFEDLGSYGGGNYGGGRGDSAGYSRRMPQGGSAYDLDGVDD